MLGYLAKQKSSASEKLPAIDLAELKVYSVSSRNFECWQNYYQDLDKAATLIRSLIK